MCETSVITLQTESNVSFKGPHRTLACLFMNAHPRTPMLAQRLKACVGGCWTALALLVKACFTACNTGNPMLHPHISCVPKGKGDMLPRRG